MFKNINSGAGCNPSYLTVANGLLFFTANDGVNGTELWVSDGTAIGTKLVKDIYSGNNGSNPYNLININGTLFFVANDGIHGNELWKSDGTLSGTILVNDIYSGLSNSSPSSLTNFDNTLFFTANDSVHGSELWKSDGTATGTTLVQDIYTGTTSSNPYNLVTSNGALFFFATDDKGTELWKSKGTTATTTYMSSSTFNGPGWLTNVNGTLYFNDGAFGNTLRNCDSIGNVKITEGPKAGKFTYINPYNQNPVYYSYFGTFSNLTNLNGTCFFVLGFKPDNGGNGDRPGRFGSKVSSPNSLGIDWTPNNNIPQLITSNINYTNLINVNSTLFYTLGNTLIKSDGTYNSGKDLKIFSTPPTLLTNVNGTLFFAANDGINGTELWKIVTPTLVSQPSDLALCTSATGQFVVNATAYLGTLTYQWQENGINISDGTLYSGTATNTLTVTGNSSTDGKNYRCVITSSTGNVVYSTYANLSLNVSSVNATASPSTICSGKSSTLTASGAATYSWSTGATTASINVSPTTTTTYTVTSTTNGCTGTATVVVTVNANPTVNATANPSTICSGSSTNLTVNGANTYSWNTGATAATTSVSPTTTTTYTVTGTTNGCAGTVTVNVAVNANPTPTITPSGATTFCQGGNVTLTASTGSSYLWSNNATTQSITVTTAADYTVAVKNASGCSATSAATTVTVNSLPTATITISGALTFCQGGNVTLTASTASSYLWSNNATTQSITVSTAGNYSVAVKNAGGCSALSAATTVTVNSLPTATITPSGATTFCQGGNVTLTASAGSSYLWSNNATTQSITVSAAGNYTVAVKNASGCSATSAATTVTVNSLPTASISASGATTFCQGGSVTLTANPSSSYLWSNNATTKTITVTTAAGYTVAVKDVNTCSATSAATIVMVNALPAVTLGANTSPLCVTNAAVALSGNPLGGSYSGTGVSGSNFNPAVSGAGTFTVSYNYTDANACSATASQTVIVNVCTGVQELTGSLVSIYPNPANDRIFVEMDASLMNHSFIEIYDAMGKIVIIEKAMNENTSITINSLATGIYTVRVVSDDKQILNRIIKE